jgi:hypothetical protein
VSVLLKAVSMLLKVVSVLLKTVSVLVQAVRMIIKPGAAFKGPWSFSNVHEKPSPGLKCAGKGCQCLYRPWECQ